MLCLVSPQGLLTPQLLCTQFTDVSESLLITFWVVCFLMMPQLFCRSESLLTVCTLNSAYNKNKYVEILLRYRQLFVKGNIIISERGLFGVEIFLHYSQYFIKGDFIIGRVQCNCTRMCFEFMTTNFLMPLQLVFFLWKKLITSSIFTPNVCRNAMFLVFYDISL